MGTVAAYISSTVTDVEECPACNHQSLAVIDATLIFDSGVGDSLTVRRCVECAPCDTE